MLLWAKGYNRDGFKEMLESIPNTFDECAEVLKQSEFIALVVYTIPDNLSIDIKLDEGFKDFFEWTKTVDIPLIIVSRFVDSHQSHLDAVPNLQSNLVVEWLL